MFVEQPRLHQVCKGDVIAQLVANIPNAWYFHHRYWYTYMKKVHDQYLLFIRFIAMISWHNSKGRHTGSLLIHKRTTSYITYPFRHGSFLEEEVELPENPITTLSVRLFYIKIFIISGHNYKHKQFSKDFFRFLRKYNKKY